MTLDDIFEMYEETKRLGYVYDTVLIKPSMAWMVAILLADLETSE